MEHDRRCGIPPALPRRDFLKVGLSTGAAAFAAAAIPPSMARAIQLPPNGVIPTLVLSFACVDTMKESRDTQAIGARLTSTQIKDSVAVAAAMNTSHISVDCTFSSSDYAQQWVYAIREAGKSVWFRSYIDTGTLVTVKGFDGNNHVVLTPSNAVAAIADWVRRNRSLFAPGDIVDPDPESENNPYWYWTYGNTWSYWTPTGGSAPNDATNAFNQYLLDSSAAVRTNVVVPHVITGIRSTNDWWATHPLSLYPSTTAQLGYVTVDGYPEGTSTNPAACASARLGILQTVAANHSAPIVIGEMGYCNNMAVNDATQRDVVQAELDALASDAVMQKRLVGINYWVGPGDDNSGGHTFIWTGGRGNWSRRPAADALATFYKQHRLAGVA